jgi:hypothetical protein
MGRREQFTVGELTVTGSILGPAGGVVNFDNLGYGIIRAGKATSAGGDATETIAVPGVDTTWDIAAVGHGVSDDTDNILAAALTSPITGAVITITGSADPSTAHSYNYAIARNGAIPAFDIVFAGTHVCTGGSTAEAITLTGALATDLGFACYGATNDTDTIAKVIMTADTMTVTMSADPSTVHSLHYMVLRPRGVSKPSHYIAYAGNATTVGGAAAEAVTITGAKLGDIPIVGYKTTDDTDTILKSVITADTLTVTCSANPGATHAFWYLILRSY